MAQIVLTIKDNLNINSCRMDMIQMAGDNVDLTGPGYALMLVKSIAGVTVAQLRTALLSKQPERAKVTKLPEVNKWSFLEEKIVWKDPVDNLWKTEGTKAKYQANWAELTTDDWDILADPSIALSVKTTLVEKVKPCISLFAANLTIESDLN